MTARRTIVALCALTVAATLSPDVVAQPAPDDADRKRANDWYELAQAAMQREDFAEAALAFDAAHRLDPDPRLLFNAARAYQRAGRLTTARARYEQFLIFKDAPEDLRKRALEEMVAVELELQRAADAETRDAEEALLRERLATERRAREEAEAKAAMEARLRELEVERTAMGARAEGRGLEAPRPERPAGLVPIRVYTHLNNGYQAIVRDSVGTEHRCAAITSGRDCRLYIAPGPYRLQTRGGLDLNETFVARSGGHSVNLRESPTGLIVGTAVSWGALGLGAGFIGIMAADTGSEGANIGLLASGILLILYALPAGPIFSILLAQEDSYIEINRADDFDPAARPSAARARSVPTLRWTGLGIGPLPEGGGVVGTGFTF